MAKAGNVSKKDLLDMLNRSSGHTGGDFGEYFGVEFSYTTATNEARDRGYVQGWYDPKDLHPEEEPEDEKKTIRLTSTEDTHRQTFMMSKAVSDRFLEKFSGVRGSSALIDYAINKLMDEIEDGKIEVKLW